MTTAVYLEFDKGAILFHTGHTDVIVHWCLVTGHVFAM